MASVARVAVNFTASFDLEWLPLPGEQLGLLHAVVQRAVQRQDGADWNRVILATLEKIEKCESAVRARLPGPIRTFEPKTRHELGAFLDLSPYISGFPLRAPASGRLLLGLRALPVHVLGVTREPAFADGQRCSPVEYFFHDLDHARFKIREDLLALGLDCPDAYQSVAGGSPSTVDPATGTHRSILGAVREAVAEAGARMWQLAPRRLALARRLADALEALQTRDRTLGDAAELLLLEMVHEKSLPMDSGILLRELRWDEHVGKLRRKSSAGFYGVGGPGSDTVVRLDEARAWLAEQVGAAA